MTAIKKIETEKLLMPMSEERSVLRKSLMPSMLHTISYNQARNINDVAIFAVGERLSIVFHILIISPQLSLRYFLFQLFY